MFALEKQTHLERKQTRFILTLPVAGAVYAYYIMYATRNQLTCNWIWCIMACHKAIWNYVFNTTSSPAAEKCE